MEGCCESAYAARWRDLRSGPTQSSVSSFDAVWDQIELGIPTRATAVEAARAKLANAVLIAASSGPVEIERIKAEALAAMTARPVELGFDVPTRFGTTRH